MSLPLPAPRWRPPVAAQSAHSKAPLTAVAPPSKPLPCSAPTPLTTTNFISYTYGGAAGSYDIWVLNPTPPPVDASTHFVLTVS